jgi:hypothetical protein
MNQAGKQAEMEPSTLEESMLTCGLTAQPCRGAVPDRRCCPCLGPPRCPACRLLRPVQAAGGT